LNRTWQPKVTAITESQNLATMTMVALFGKVREHELELGRLNDEEDIGRKKNIAFKTEVVKGKKQKEEEDSDSNQKFPFTKLLQKAANEWIHLLQHRCQFLHSSPLLHYVEFSFLQAMPNSTNKTPSKYLKKRLSIICTAPNQQDGLSPLLPKCVPCQTALIHVH